MHRGVAEQLWPKGAGGESAFTSLRFAACGHAYLAVKKCSRQTGACGDRQRPPAKPAGDRRGGGNVKTSGPAPGKRG
eukprot:scaffold44246_cov17-Prasinocladus_malaysianus.AAC.1